MEKKQKTGREIDKEVANNIKIGFLMILIIVVLYLLPIHTIPKYAAMAFISLISIEQIFLFIGALLTIVIGSIGPIGKD